MDTYLLAHGGAPAGGAPTEDLIPAVIVAALAAAGLAVFGWAHRSGRTALLTRAAAFAERVSGLPGWAAVPAAVTGTSLVVAAFGFYWDVSTHIDAGRDVGPFANASHFWIIAGLAGIAVAGYLSILLGAPAAPTSIRIRDGWYAPLGGALLLLCGGIAVFGFPLDDVWHRLFGQDVTLWSPTHLQMVGGAALSTLALWILHSEAERAPVDAARAAAVSRWAEPAIAGAFLIGLSAFQAEFDYSVPQFRLLYHPVLLMLSSGIALVAARIRMGRGGALKALALFIALRGLFSLIIGPGLGHTTLHFPLYVIEALAVEAVAAAMGTTRQVSFGVAAGAAIGTFGLAAEWAWSHVWMTISWPASLLPEGVLLAPVAGVAGGALGGYIGRALLPPDAVRQRTPRAVQAAVAVGVLVALFYPLPTDAAHQGSVTVRLEDVPGREGRWVNARLSMEPAGVAEDSEWFNVTSWQGGGSVVVEPERVGPGKYRTDAPIPVHGEWKTLIRLQRNRSLMAVPIFMPEDPAIPAEEVPAEPRFTRELMSDKKLVLREAKDVEAPLTYGASAALVTIAVLWVVALGWGLRRLERSGVPDRARPSFPRETTAEVV